MPGAGFPRDETALEVAAAFGANLSDDLSTLGYTILTPSAAERERDYVKSRVVITRGRVGDAGQTQPTTIQLGLRNPKGRFSPRNPLGPYWGLLRRQTPLRVRLDPGSGMVTRGISYVPGWPPRWTGPDIDDRIPIEAAGITRQLGVGQPTKSALLRSTVAAGPVEYWPMEDGADTTIAASALPGGSPLVVQGDVNFASTAGPPGSGPLCDGLLVDEGSLVVPTVRLPAGTGPWQVSFVMSPNENAAGVLLSWSNPASTSFPIWRIAYGTEAPSILVDRYSPSTGWNSTLGAEVGETSGFHYIAVRFAQSGGNISTALIIDGVTQASTSFTDTLGPPTNGAISPHSQDFIPNGRVSAGHFAFWDNNDDLSDLYQAMLGYPGELAADRFGRLCIEEGLTADVAAGTSEPMGPQLPGTILDLLRECEAADEAVMVERRTGELGFDPRVTRYNLPVAMTLDYQQGHVTDIEMGDDDRDLRNYVTVTRIGGSSPTVEQVTGPVGTDPATGVGRYPDPQQRSLHTDEQALQHAGWLTNLGTADEPRYALIVDLYAHPELVTEWLACDIGSRVLVVNPPVHTGPAPLDVIIEGYQEILDATEWLLILHVMPYRPYEVFQIETGDGSRSRIPAGTSTLDATYDEGDITLSVTSAATRWIDSATYPGDFPFVITIAGEVMTCTAITGTGLTQTFTVARALYGTPKILPVGSAVQLFRPAANAL